MHKNYVLVWGLLMAIGALGSAPAGGGETPIRIATVDMKKVFAAYFKTKEAEKSVNEAKAKAKLQLDERNAKYKSLISKWQELHRMIADPQLNEVLREQKQREANGVAAEAKALEREMAEFRSRRERGLQEQVMRMRRAILDEIRDEVRDAARRRNIDLLFDGSGQSIMGVELLLYSKDTVDLSTHVIDQLNGSKGDSQERDPA